MAKKNASKSKSKSNASLPTENSSDDGNTIYYSPLQDFQHIQASLAEVATRCASDEAKAILDGLYEQVDTFEERFLQKIKSWIAQLEGTEDNNSIDTPTSASSPPKKKSGKMKRTLSQPSSTSKAESESSKRLATSKIGSNNNNLTPKRPVVLSSPVVTTTPSNYIRMTRRRHREEEEKARQEKLLLSQEKIRKAEENKRNLLVTKKQNLKEDREKRMVKFKENQLKIEQKIKKVDSHDHGCNSVASGESNQQLANSNQTKRELRNAERRQKLENLERKLENNKPKGKGKQKNKATDATDSKKGKDNNGANVAVEKTAQDGQPIFPNEQETFSPIQSNDNNKNRQVDITFKVSELAGHDLTVAPHCSTMMPQPGGSSTLMAPQSSASTVPTTPPRLISKVKLGTQFNSLAKKKLADEITSYAMTPPLAEKSCHNYDISTYVDSDAEEELVKKSEKGKHIPRWARHNPFNALVHAQFSKPAEELQAIPARLFPPPVLPVPLEDMGLPTREGYTTRTSSINWDKGADVLKFQIEIAFKFNEAGKKEDNGQE